jgi:phosphoserine phosphatase RsbU/P
MASAAWVLTIYLQPRWRTAASSRRSMSSAEAPPPDLMLEADEDLRDLYEAAPCAYLSISADGRIVKFNQTLLNWTGYRSDALAGLGLSELLSSRSRVYYDTHVVPLLRMRGHADEIEIDLLASPGCHVPVVASVTEKRRSDGSLLMTRLVALKAADRRRHERRLVAAREAAEERLLLTQEHEAEVSGELEEERSLATLREQFIAVLGHDLRNPLAAVLSGINLLSRSHLGEDDQKVLTLMKGSVTRANRLVDDVLDLARSRLGGGIAVKRGGPQPLGPIIEQVVDEMRSISPTRSITLDMSLPEPVNCDTARIAQLLSNLLGNAVKHGAPDRPVLVEALTVDGKLILSVANGGKPIPQAAMRLLFKPFFRGDSRPAQQGLGLGLHIAAQIAEAHGGALTASSDETETRFTFTMPIGQDEVPPQLQ